MKFAIYRYQPETDKKPSMKSYELDGSGDMMVLTALLRIKDEQDESLSFRRSCREGVCGSCAMNINGKNKLACVTPISEFSGTINIRPLPGLPVHRDLVCDLTQFYDNYYKVNPFLQTKNAPPSIEYEQTPEQRAKLDGLYECILCACCTTSCPSYWWNPDKFLGPAAALQAARFIEDSRDEARSERLSQLEDAYSVMRCRGIMSCVDVCPKGLNPTQAISTIRSALLKEGG